MDKLETGNFDFKKYKNLIRYVIVGVINTGVDVLTFSLLKGFFGVPLAVSQIAGYGAGILNSFLMNKFWTFENNTGARKATGQAVKFVVVNIVTLGISIYGLQLLAESMHMNVYIAKGIITLFTMVLNYFGYKLWVFKDA